MDEDHIMAEHRDPATEAFSRLEGELALMRRGVEQMAREKAQITIPDYSATLGEMSQNMEYALQALKHIAGKPAMELTLEDLARRIDNAARQARQTDHEELRGAHDRFDTTSRELRTMVATVHAADEQRRRLVWAAGGGLLAGILLWSVFPGAFVRALPPSWLIPEGMATRVLREPTLWEAGARLMKAGNPEAWQTLIEAADMLRDNRQAIDMCQKAAKQMGKSTHCSTIDVKAGQ